MMVPKIVSLAASVVAQIKKDHILHKPIFQEASPKYSIHIWKGGQRHRVLILKKQSNYAQGFVKQFWQNHHR